MSHRADAGAKAILFVQEFAGVLAEKFVNEGTVGGDFEAFEGAERYFYERMDQEFSLDEAEDVLAELAEFQEQDSGFWEGMEPDQAFITQAGCAFRRALRSFLGRNLEVVDRYLKGKYTKDSSILTIKKDLGARAIKLLS